MKKLLAILLAAVMVMSLFAGCGDTAPKDPVSTPDDGDAAQSEELGLVGFSTVSMSESIYVLQEAALKEVFAGKATVQTQSCDQDAAAQIQHIKNFTLMGADLIIINPTDIDALADAIMEAHNAGVKIYINGATSDSLSEEYYECCTVSDEYLCGAYIAMIAKNWIEAHADQLDAANPDWEVAFIESSLADETLKRTYGLESIIEPYLVDWEGNYVDVSGNIVDEAGKVENPAYCQLAAEHYKGAKAEQDQTDGGRNVRDILTSNPNARVFLCYNSLASVQGGQYVVDNYGDQIDEFAFFSGGVMGNEADYIVGSASETEGVRSVMRGAVQFGVSAAGNDVADSVANTAYAIMYGEEGVDYTKKNPDGIAAWWAVEEEWSPEGVASVAHFNILSGATVQAFDPIATLDDPNTIYYWNSVDGFVENAAEEEEPAVEPETPDAPVAGAAIAAGDYTYMEPTPFGEVKWVVTLNEDGTAVVAQPENESMGNPTWTATWTDNGDGTYTTADCQGEGPQIAGFWENNSIVWAALNENMTVPVKADDYADKVAQYGLPEGGEAAAPAGAAIPTGEYTYMEPTPFGEVKWTVTLNEDGTAVVAQPENASMGNPTWTAVWTDNGDGTFVTAECQGEGPQIAGFWENNSIVWAALNENMAVPVKADNYADMVAQYGLLEAGEAAEGAGDGDTYTFTETNGFGLTINWSLVLNADGTYVLTEVNDFVGEMSYQGTEYSIDGDTVTCGAMVEGPGMFEWANPAGFSATLNADGTFAPVK